MRLSIYHFEQTGFCTYVILSSVVSSHQHVDELSEGLIWASWEGCLEDVIFLLSTGVEVNTRGQVRLRMSLLGHCIFPIKHQLAKFVPMKLFSSKNVLLTSQARAADPVNQQKNDLFCCRSIKQTAKKFSRPTINLPIITATVSRSSELDPSLWHGSFLRQQSTRFDKHGNVLISF